MITKGALSNVLAVCSQAETADGPGPAPGPGAGARFSRILPNSASRGCAPWGSPTGGWAATADIGKDDEAGMTFLGFLLVYDPPKPGVADIIRQMKQLGVSLKIITGDNALVAANLARQVGFAQPRICSPARNCAR